MEERVLLNLEFPRSGQTLWVQVPHWMTDGHHGCASDSMSWAMSLHDRDREMGRHMDEGLCN